MARKSKGLIWLEYAAARLVIDGFALLPRRAAVACGVSLARLLYPFLGSLRRTGTRNLEIAFPEKAAGEREQLLKASIENLGRVLGELSQFRRTTADDLAELVDLEFESDETRHSEEFEHYESERAKGRGVILVGPHLGNWEIGVFAYSAFREPIAYLARPLDNPRIEEMLAAMRSRFGNRAINKTNSVGAAIEILRSGGVVGVLPDVNSHPKEGVFVPFFGVPACTAAGVAMLALRTNAMIIPMCAVWDEARGRYHALHGDRAIDPVRTGDRHRDVIETTAAYTASLEGFIRAYPDQWMWIHKRWKTRPPGEKSLYD
jgi:KDO2-lipid IV(A) lauroyltransferase